VLSGARAGTRRELNADFATLGRHPSSELQLDPEKDTEVSPRHAAVFRQGPGFVVRDLGSATGTWVNGTRVRSDRSLENGDRIRLGAQGPEIEFTVEQTHERPPARLVEPDEPLTTHPQSPMRRSAVIEQEQSMTELKLRVEAARQTDKLRRRLFAAAVVAVLAVFAAIAWLGWSARQSRLALEREQNRLFAKVDSVHALLGAAAERSPGLRSALEKARSQTEQLRARIASEGTSGDGITILERQVQQELDTHDPLLRAALFDPTPVVTRNSRAIAMVFSAFASGGRSRANGFVLRVNADTGWVVTSRAILVDSAGTPAERIAVGFNGGAQAWRARVIAEQAATGLALLQVPAGGHAFPIAEVRDSGVVNGESVVVFGFAVADLGETWQRNGLRASVLTGTLVGSGGDRLVIDGYGTPAWTGSAVFNATGQLIGVMSDTDSTSRLLRAIPTSAIRGWMRE
jgi:S1-C subfamily serine protease